MSKKLIESDATEAAVANITDTMTKQSELQTLKGKMTGIIGRIVATLLLIAVFEKGDFSQFFITYLVVSYCWIFIKATGNFIIGIIAFLAFLLVGIEMIMEKIGDKAGVLAVILILGVFIIDLINIIKYIKLKIQLRNA